MIILLKYLVKLEIVEKCRQDCYIYYNDCLFTVSGLRKDIGMVMGIIKEDNVVQYEMHHCIPQTYNQFLKDLL